MPPNLSEVEDASADNRSKTAVYPEKPLRECRECDALCGLPIPWMYLEEMSIDDFCPPLVRARRQANARERQEVLVSPTPP